MNRTAPAKASSWYSSLHDCESAYIDVPCGHCADCISLRQMFVAQRCIMEAQNSHVFFTTLTYNNEYIPRFVTSSGFEYRFADIRDLQCMFKRLRKYNTFGRPFRYFAVSERGSLRGRPHFHILWFLKKFEGETFADGLSLQSLLFTSILSEWKRNYGSTRVPDYRNLCTYKRKFYRGKLHTNYDTHFVVPSLTSAGISSVVFYINKYMFKDDKHLEDIRSALKLNLPADEYSSSFRLIRSRYFASTSFGFGFPEDTDNIVAYIKQCISLSDRSKPLPSFFIPDSSVVLPLCSLYRNKFGIFSVDDKLEFECDPFFYDSRSKDDRLLVVKRYDDICSKISDDLSINFNFLFE